VRGRSRTVKIAIALGAVALVTVLVAGGVAVAHQFSDGTKLTISRSPTGEVAPGTVVTFTGKLKLKNQDTGHHSCVADQTVRLFKKKLGPDKKVGKDETNRTGKYKIDQGVQKTRRFYAKFDGKDSGVHPHSHVCLASKSDAIKVKVR
jgi:hypothetical protein